MRKRAEDVARTRRRIVEATVELHGTVGLGVSIAQIAERAGVTRATVYRHFPDIAQLFAACSAHWQDRQHPPDPARWVGPDPATRLRAALSDVYRFYDEAADMLVRVDRDRDLLPSRQAEDYAAQQAALQAGLLALLTTGARQQMRVRRVTGHVLQFRTWHSLVIEQQLPHQDAVELMATLLERSAELPGDSRCASSANDA